MSFLKFCNLVKSIDLFGVPVGLVMNKQTHYKSLAGSLASVVAIIFIFAFFWQNFISFIRKDRAIYNIDNQYQQSPDLIELDQSSFMFALGFEQPNSDFTTYPFFNITATQTYYKMEGQKRKTQTVDIDMEPCTEEHFSLMGKDKYQKITILNSRNFICPKQGQKIQLQGLYTNQLFSFVKIIVTRCDPNFKQYDKRTWKPLNCGSQSDYDAFIKMVSRPRFIFYTTNFNIIPSNTNNYAQSYIQDQQSFTFSPYSMVKSADIYIKKNIIKTDENVLLTKDTREETYLTLNLDEIKETSDYVTGSNSFVNLFLRRSPYNITINRSFTKIADLMIQIGGLIKCVILVLGFFLQKYNRFNFRLELANKLYEFNLSNSQKKIDKQQKNNPTIFSQEKSVENQLLFNPSQKNLSQNNCSPKDLERLNEPVYPGTQQKSLEISPQNQKEGQRSVLIDYVQRIAQKSVKIKGSISYFLNYLTFGKCLITEKNQLIKKAQDYSKTDLDIYVILDKLQEIEKLKKIIFSPEQITLFNFIKKPVIKNDLIYIQKNNQLDIKSQSAKQKFIQSLYLKQMKDIEQVQQQKQQQSQPQAITIESDHFMKERDSFTTFQAYKNLFDAYKAIKRSEEFKNEIQNQKLISELGEEIQNLFELNSLISQKNVQNSEVSQAILETNNQFQMFLQISPLNKNHRYKNDSNKLSKQKSEKQTQGGAPIISKQQITTAFDIRNDTQNDDKKKEDLELPDACVIHQNQQQFIHQNKFVQNNNNVKDFQNDFTSSYFSNSLVLQENISNKIAYDSVNNINNTYIL